jgi:hypothetical protein
MKSIRILGALAFSSFVATAALAAQPQDGNQTQSVTNAACRTNSSFVFCEVASADGSTVTAQQIAQPAVSHLR